MTLATLGIIGGSGLGEELLKLGGSTVEVDTPFGPPSCPPIVAVWSEIRVAFIARHGIGHRFNPSNVPYRANIWAMKKLGVRAIIASGATGSLREDIEPGHLVLCDQVIDKTHRRSSTFFDEGIVAHVEMAHPFCPSLRKLLAAAGTNLSTTVHHAGTYVCMEGPQFSTRAESHMHRAWGGDLIGMTCMPEAKLAREAQLCYAMIALPTDYDCWRPHAVSTSNNDLLAEITGNLKRATDHAITLMREAIAHWSELPSDCGCRQSLKLAVWSEKKRTDEPTSTKLSLLLGEKG